MKLEQTIFVFSFDDKNKKNDKIDFKNSFLYANGCITDIPATDIFSKVTAIRDTSIKGYSMLEFLDEKGNICIEDSDSKILNISFIDNSGNFFKLTKKYDPQIRPNALDVDEQSLKQIINKIENFLNNIHEKSDTLIFFNNPVFNSDVEIAKDEGYILTETLPRSNLYVLKKDKDNFYLIEVNETDYDIVSKDDYVITFKDEFFKAEKINA